VRVCAGYNKIYYKTMIVYFNKRDTTYRVQIFTRTISVLGFAQRNKITNKNCN